jgi:hypothetical protein
MARPRKTVPALVHHKPTNRVRVRINGRDVWCGRWDRGAKEPQPGLKPGDVVEVEIDGLGVLRNPVEAE